jgi:hypothetical protein
MPGRPYKGKSSAYHRRQKDGRSHAAKEGKLRVIYTYSECINGNVIITKEQHEAFYG